MVANQPALVGEQRLRPAPNFAAFPAKFWIGQAATAEQKAVVAPVNAIGRFGQPDRRLADVRPPLAGAA